MAPVTRYQALPARSDEDRRRTSAVSAVSSDNGTSHPATATLVSSDRDPPTWSPRPLENEAFVSPSHFNLRKATRPEELLIDEQDITSVSSYDDERRSKNPPASLPETNISQFHTTALDWLPYTLRKPYLFAIFSLSIALALVTILLSWASSINDGLGDDNKTSTLLFGWRFTPTLVVVLFVVLETLLLNDARRTEVFARLSNPSTNNASSTVLEVRGHWWNDPLNALSSKRNGGLTSRVLLCAAIMNTIGSFVLSPLSAAFLSVEPTRMSRSGILATLHSISNATAVVSPDDQTYFRSISALVVNLTTSVWLTNDYAIVPFWPDGLTKPPLGATVPVEAQNWTADTTIFQAELSCVPMTLKNLQNDSFQLVSDDGCLLGVEVGIPEDTDPSIASYEASNNEGPTEDDAQEDSQFFFPILNSGSWWVPTSVKPDDFSSVLNNPVVNFRNQTIITNVSSACQDRCILAVNTPFNISYSYPTNVSVSLNDSDIHSNLSSFLIDSYVCGTRFMMANLTATLSISSSNTIISFDQAVFNQRKVEMKATDFNVSSFDSAFYSDTWMKKLNTSDYGTWLGPSAPLGARYGYNVSTMMNDPLLLSKAQQVQQRFFGEGLMAAFSNTVAQGSTLKGGMIAVTRNRIVASFGIGVTMGILFLCTTLMAILVFYYSRLSRRPLNLDRDPGSAAAVSSLLKNAATRSHFQGLDRVPEPIFERRLEDLHFEMQNRGLIAQHTNNLSPGSEPPQMSYSKDWRPFVLRGFGSLSLILAIFLLIAGLSVLFAMSETKGIYQKGLVYQFSISFKDGYVTSLAPYSIIPTLIAVGGQLWWVAVEETFKRLQPYVTMTKRPVPLSAGASLSYQSIPPVWSIVKAVRMKHWLLAMICTGTVLMEAFTVGMSALFQRNESSLTSDVILSRDVRLREIPQIFLVNEPSEGDDGDLATPEILAQLYGESQILLSWMYGAVIELAYVGSSLPWTQDDWSFAPVNLNSSKSTGPGISATNEAANVTLDTPSLRGRLECTPVDMSNTSNWLTTWDLTNSSLWNMSAVIAEEKQYKIGYELGVGLLEPTFFMGAGPKNETTGLWSTFFANPSRVRCCANETDDGPGLAALGYWAPVGISSDLEGAQGHGAQDGGDFPTITNFTVTWVIGKPFVDEWEAITGENDTDAFNGYYIWSEIPEVVALNCAPVIEHSNATITVNFQDEQVVDFSLRDEPSVHEPAWSDYYLHHNNSGENGDNIAYQIKDNVTVSYGYLFLDAMLGAADSARVAVTERWGYHDEPVNDRIFAFRQTGYNSDLMSYATWSILEGNFSALLDPIQLANTSSIVFGTFFQHFASENGSSGGGRAYMPLNLTLPADFLPIVNSTDSGEPAAYQDTNSITVTSPTVSAVLSRPVYRLEMSKVAVGLSLGVLVFLGFTTLVICIGYRHYFKALPRDMNTLASIIALVYDSPKLLQWVAEHGVEEKQHSEQVKAIIGYFQGSEGDTRWGIELVDESYGKKVYAGGNSSGVSTEYELLNIRSPEVEHHRM